VVRVVDPLVDAMKFRHVLIGLVLSLTGAVPALAGPVDPRIAWQDDAATAACDYCGDYRDKSTDDVVSTSWSATWGYDLARKIEAPAFVAETGCAYCGDYTDNAPAIQVASTWKPGQGYSKAPRTARAGWWFW
jgi:hypothetical protein